MVKFNEAKKICEENFMRQKFYSVNEISSDYIGRVENIMRRNLPPLKFHATLLPCPKTYGLYMGLVVE